jgi:hypothetical protein
MEKVGIFFGYFEYIMAIWHIFWQFGNLVALWYIFPRFGILCQEKSGNPEHLSIFYSLVNTLRQVLKSISNPELCHFLIYTHSY